MNHRFSASYFLTVALVLSMVLCARAFPHKIIRFAEMNIIPVITRIEPDAVIAGRKMEIVMHGTGISKSFAQTRLEVNFPNHVVQRLTYNNTNTFFSATVPPSVAPGAGTLSVRVGDLFSNAVNIVVLPDTFPYTPLHPEYLGTSEVTTTSFRCHWSKCYRALGYLLDVSTDNFKTFVPGYKSLVVTDTSKLISGLAPGTLYGYRLRPYSDSDTAAYQNYFSYLMTLPLAPVAAPLLVLSESDFICSWSNVKGADEYLIEASADFFNNSISTYVEDTLAILTLSGRLRWTISYRVRAINSSGMSAYSNVITVIITGIEDETAQVTFYPNPAKDQVFISGLYEAVNESRVIDINGKVTTVSLSNVGDNTFGLDIQALPNGLYILQMVVNQRVIQHKFIKQ